MFRWILCKMPPVFETSQAPELIVKGNAAPGFADIGDLFNVVGGEEVEHYGCVRISIAGLISSSQQEGMRQARWWKMAREPRRESSHGRWTRKSTGPFRRRETCA